MPPLAADQTSEVQVTAVEPAPVVAELPIGRSPNRKSIPAVQVSSKQAADEANAADPSGTAPPQETNDIPGQESDRNSLSLPPAEQLPAAIDPATEPLVLQAQPVGPGPNASRVAIRPEDPEVETTPSANQPQPPAAVPGDDDVSFLQLPSIGGTDPASAAGQMEAPPVDAGSRVAAFRNLPARTSAAPAALPLNSEAFVGPRTLAENTVTTERPYYLPPQQILRLKAITPIDQPMSQPNQASILMRDTVVLDGTHLLVQPEKAEDGPESPARIPAIDHQQLREALKRLSPSSGNNGQVQR